MKSKREKGKGKRRISYKPSHKIGIPYALEGSTGSTSWQTEVQYLLEARGSGSEQHKTNWSTVKGKNHRAE